MKPRTDIAHMGTIGKKNRTQMTLDANSLAHLMSVLTDLYSDPELAVIREYATNALDSHIASGNTNPIEVDLPTPLRALFVIRDFGLGMSQQDVEENFSKYGYSSKRETDEQVGMLGLGCKSALTYSSQFTFIATKDNIQSTVLVTRDETGAGALQIMDSRRVGHENGVEIQIPVKGDIANFNAKAEGFFSFWDPGTVLINGKPNKSLWDPKYQKEQNITVLDKDLILRSGNNMGYVRPRPYFHGQQRPVNPYDLATRNFIVMGNVPYPVETQLSSILQGGVVARVPVGTVNFTPSREQLQDTALTKDTIRDIQKRVESCTVQAAQTDVSSQKTPFDALVEYNKWMRLSGNRLQAQMTYRGNPLPKDFKNDTERTMHWSGGYYNDSPLNVGDRASRFERSIPTSHVSENLLVVTDHKAKQIAKGTKQRILKHLEKLQETDPGITFTNVFLTANDPFGTWVKHKITLDELREYAVAQAPRKPKSKGTFRTVTAGGREEVKTDLDDKITKVLIPAGDGDVVRASIGSALHERTDAVGVIVGANQVESFKKKQQNVISVAEFVEREVKTFNASVTPLESWFFTGVPNAVATLNFTFGQIPKGAQLDDPSIGKAIATVNQVDIPVVQAKFNLIQRLLWQHPTMTLKDLTCNDKGAKPFFG